jgi:formylmethanofuran dehydrogenase subunit C
MTTSNSGTKELETLQDMFIVTLLQASVPQQTVRKIVKVDLKRVTRIGKLLKATLKQEE